MEHDSNRILPYIRRVFAEADKAKEDHRKLIASFPQTSGRSKESELNLQRNACLGLSAIGVAIIIQLLQVGALSAELQASLLAAATCVPLGVGAAGVTETYVTLGEKFYGHYKKIEYIVGSMMLMAGICCFISVAAALAHMNKHAAYAFLAASVIAIAVLGVCYEHLGRWWSRNQTEEESSPEQRARAVLPPESPEG